MRNASFSTASTYGNCTHVRQGRQGSLSNDRLCEDNKCIASRLHYPMGSLGMR